jgi:oligosaccharyltransferase complex subunit gamma
MKSSSIILGLAALAGCAMAMDINEKVGNLHDMTMRQGIIKINSEKFDLYVRSRPRNYSVIAMTTALNPSRGCSICGEAYEEYKILYNSYRSSNRADFEAKKVFFVLVDYDEASEVFSSLKLNSAPGFFHFPGSAQKADKSQDKLDIQRKGYQADSLAKWVADRTGVSVSVTRPPSYAGLMIILGVVALIGLLAFTTGFNFKWLNSSKLWGCISVLIILTFTSGQMWNHIRGPPPMGRGQGSKMQFIASGSQMQYVFETYWVFVMYGMTSFGVILMGDHAGNKSMDAGKRKVAGVAGVAIFIIFYSLALATFREKYAGYPYKLLF